MLFYSNACWHSSLKLITGNVNCVVECMVMWFDCLTPILIWLVFLFCSLCSYVLSLLFILVNSSGFDLNWVTQTKIGSCVSEPSYLKLDCFSGCLLYITGNLNFLLHC